MFEYDDGRVAVRTRPPGRLSEKEIHLLRELAHRVADIGSHPVQAQRIAFHRRHNALEGERPALLCFPEGAWEELVPMASMTCRDPFWQGYECYLRRLLYRWAHIPDDFVTEPALGVPLCADLTGWGAAPRRAALDMPGSSWRYEPVLTELHQWRSLLKPIDLTVDEAVTSRAFQAVGEVLGDILPVYVDRSFCEANPLLLETLCGLRGMENLYYDLVDEEEEVHAILSFLQDSWLALYDRIEASTIFTSNTGNHYIGSGGIGFCNMPPHDPAHPLKGMWGFCEAQELANVSPAMYHDFATTYYRPLLERFGLGCVGCCENLDGKLVDLAESLPNLRRVSVSPWTNLPRARREIGGRVILSWKPSPSLVAGFSYDPESVERYLADNLSPCCGVPLEIILKDTQTVHGEGERLTKFLQNARTAVERYCQ